MSHPHAGQPIVTAGTALDRAAAAMIMIHGRGATADSILTLTSELPSPGFAFLAPQAAGNTWYPYSFLAPVPQNEPWLGSAISSIASVLARAIAAGVPADRVILLGFSQGACLALEFAARHARRFGGVAALSGGLIGPPGTPRDYPGSLAGTPVFLGCSDRDPHIPLAQVHASADVMALLGGEVDKRIYPGLGHSVNEEEIGVVQRMMADVLSKAIG